jgi:hypothetical protein
MILNLEGRELVRLQDGLGVDDIDFSDLITAERTGPAVWVSEGVLEIPLSVEPTPEQAVAIRTRLTTRNLNEETIMNRARELYTDLRAIRNTTGSLSNAQLSNAVRVLARGEIAMLRLLLKELDGVD